MSLKISPCYLNELKMNFKNFSRAQFSKLRNGINGVGEQPKFRINRITGLEIIRGDLNCTRTHTYRYTHIDAYFIILVFLRKNRNNTNKLCAHGFRLLVLPIRQPLCSAHCRAPASCDPYSGEYCNVHSIGCSVVFILGRHYVLPTKQYCISS